MVDQTLFAGLVLPCLKFDQAQSIHVSGYGGRGGQLGMKDSAITTRNLQRTQTVRASKNRSAELLRSQQLGFAIRGSSCLGARRLLELCSCVVQGSKCMSALSQQVGTTAYGTANSLTLLWLLHKYANHWWWPAVHVNACPSQQDTSTAAQPDSIVTCFSAAWAKG